VLAFVARYGNARDTARNTVAYSPQTYAYGVQNASLQVALQAFQGPCNRLSRALPAMGAAFSVFKLVN